MKKCLILQGFCLEVENLIQGTLVFNGQIEDKNIQKYSVLLKNSVFVVSRDSRCQPHNDSEGALQLSTFTWRAEWWGHGSLAH